MYQGNCIVWLQAKEATMAIWIVSSPPPVAEEGL
jgi:hypothetical protein